MPAAPNAPIAIRRRLLILWVVLASVPFWFALILPANGHLKWVFLGVGGAASIVLELVGIPRCMRVTVEVSAEGVAYRNMFGSGCYRWAELSEVTLRRYVAIRSADQQRLSQVSRGLSGGVSPPAVALRTVSGRLSSPITATLVMSLEERRHFVRSVKTWAPREVDVRLMEPAAGPFSLATWDLRVGKGMTEKPSTEY
jgi:hypothetical protein